MQEYTAVKTDEQLRLAEGLAAEIWREFFTPLLGADQVEYMLPKFQSFDAIKAAVTRDGYRYFLLSEEGGAYYGYVAVVLREDYLYLSKFYIKSDRRGKGRGRVALEFIKSLARDAGKSAVRLNVYKKNPTLAAYEKFGFRTIASTVEEIGGGYVLDDYVMELLI